MAPQVVKAPVLGTERVEAQVLACLVEADLEHGPRRILRVTPTQRDEGGTYRVLEADCTPLL